MKTIRVQLEQPYDVLIGRRLLAGVGQRIRRELRPSSVLAITSSRIARLHGRALLNGFDKDVTVNVIRLPDGESSKSISVLASVLEKFAQAGADRRSCVVAFGGGVICDLAGFAASVYMRGIPIVHVPTTLLAQADAAIGGKTAVNLSAAKNLVGTFHQPRLVIADPDVLDTLPFREYRAGLFEVIKCGIIRDPSLFHYLEKNAKEILARAPGTRSKLIAAAVRVKARIVAVDEKESGLRRVLNFGHTIGHALEAATAYKRLLHGEAVALGMMAAVEIGVNMGTTPEAIAERTIACILSYGPLPKVKVGVARVIRALGYDKKSIASTPRFVLIDRLGSTVIRGDVPVELIRQAVRSVTA